MAEGRSDRAGARSRDAGGAGERQAAWTLEAAPDAPREQLEAAARALPGVVAAIGDKSVRKVIVVPGKIVNIVVG